jgi:hypothetical protein
VSGIPGWISPFAEPSDLVLNRLFMFPSLFQIIFFASAAAAAARAFVKSFTNIRL